MFDWQGIADWWCWFKREVLSWSHPDAGLDLLVEGYGGWLQTLAQGPVVTGAASLSADGLDPNDPLSASGVFEGQTRVELLKSIQQAMELPRGAGLSRLMAIEAQLTNLYSDARLARRMWAFEHRFKRVAAGAAPASDSAPTRSADAGSAEPERGQKDSATNASRPAGRQAEDVEAGDDTANREDAVPAEEAETGTADDARAEADQAPLASPAPEEGK